MDTTLDRSRPNASGLSKPPEVGPLLRDWRVRRRYSQMELALDVGVSPRHLSFIETGRSRPSAAMLEALADKLDVPLRERNNLLLAAGFAPRYPKRVLHEPGLERIRQSVLRLLELHDPYPGVALDRHWNVVLANGASGALVSLLPDHLKQPNVNIFRASLHPDGLAAFTENFEDWARYLMRTLRRSVMLNPEPEILALEREVSSYATVAALPPRNGLEADCLIPCVLRLPHGRLSLFTTLTTFGTPQDVTLEEMCIELFYPADEASEALLRSAAAGQTG